MQIRYKSITHERTEDAPFIGALICSTDCKFGCKGCINNSIKRQPTLRLEACEIIQQVLSNPFNKGIILAGLEWSLQPLELVELSKLASESGLQVMIYTGCDLNEFYRRIGEAITKDSKRTDYVEKVSLGDPSDMYDVIGRMALDNAIPEDYYIKCGRYDKELKVLDNVQFGVRLSTSNQKIYKIAKGEINNVKV